MKRKGNLWTKIIDKSNLYLAFEKAKRHKSWQRKVKIIEANLDYYIEKLQNDLITGQYKTAEYKLKTIYEPKKRDIYILPFYPDRIVHHAIMNVLEPIWDNRFIYNSYACRKNKGQHKGSIKCLVRKSTAKRMKRRIKRLKYELLKNKISKDKALSVVASLSGWLRWANSYNLRMFLELESLKKELGGNS